MALLSLVILFFAATRARGEQHVELRTNTSKYYRVDFNDSDSSMQVDLSFKSCDKADGVIFALEASAMDTLYCTLSNEDLQATLQERTPVNKTVSFKPDLLISSCKKHRSVRMVMNTDNLTLTILPLTYQASLTFANVVPINYTYLLLMTLTFVVDWDMYIERVPVQNSQIRLPEVDRNQATQSAHSSDGTSYAWLNLKATKATFVRFVVDVNVQRDSKKPFEFLLKSGQSKVTVEMTCNVLKLTTKLAPTKSDYESPLFGDCNRMRTVVVQLNTVMKRLTVTVLPLTTQGSLTHEQEEALSANFQKLIFEPNDIKRPWTAYVIPLKDTDLPQVQIQEITGSGGSASCLKGLPGHSLVYVLVVACFGALHLP